MDSRTTTQGRTVQGQQRNVEAYRRSCERRNTIAGSRRWFVRQNGVVVRLGLTISRPVRLAERICRVSPRSTLNPSNSVISDDGFAAVVQVQGLTSAATSGILI